MKNDKEFSLNDQIRGGFKECYMGGIRVPYIPTDIDCWSNPLDEYKNTREKADAWSKAGHQDVMALDSKGEQHLVKDYDMGRLAFVAGVWCIQEKLPYKIMRIRDKDMVLIEKLNRIENTLFEFYSAKTVSYNCYGPFISKDKSYDYIVAKYETDNGALWGYGKTLEDARAYLGIKLYDEYKDVIHRIACRDKLRNK